MQKGESLAGKQDKRKIALAALISAPTVEAAARKSGLSHTTLYKFLGEPEFRNEYEKLNEQILSDACASVLRGMQDAIITLWDICNDKEQSGQTRVQAARAILEYGSKLKEDYDMEQRIRVLEEKAGL